MRELALFDLDIDSKLRACDLVLLRVRDVCHGDRVAARAIVLQQKSQRPVQFEITAQTREALETWIKRARLKSESFLFPSRVSKSPHLGARQYANRRSLGRGNRSRSEFVRNTFDAQDESIVALPTHEEPQGGSAASRAHQARKHSTISRHRGRRRTGDRGTDRGVSAGSLSGGLLLRHRSANTPAHRRALIGHNQPWRSSQSRRSPGNGRPRAVTRSLNLAGA